MVPATIPGHDKGITILNSNLNSLAPSNLAASNIFESICSNAALTVLYISGNATTVAAITVADHEKIIEISILLKKVAQKPLFPKYY